VTCHPRGENYGDRTQPGPCVPHGRTPVTPQCPLPSRGDALFSEQGPGIVVVVSCTKLSQPRVHLGEEERGGGGGGGGGREEEEEEEEEVY
jgi:hypothetical protein